MTPDRIRPIVIEVIDSVAPGCGIESVAGDADLREELELDSMDFLNIVAALHQRLGVAIPEADAAELTTLDRVVDYMAAKTPA
ncbi:MAG: acyl carrier protein [Azospirillaceae bacterium]